MEEVIEKLISINFKRCYFGFGNISEEESQYLNNTFILTVTNRTKNNGYSGYDSEYLELYKEYTLERMDVSQSSSSVFLKEIPGISFNSVNFEFKIKE